MLFRARTGMKQENPRDEDRKVINLGGCGVHCGCGILPFTLQFYQLPITNLPITNFTIYISILPFHFERDSTYCVAKNDSNRGYAFTLWLWFNRIHGIMLPGVLVRSRIKRFFIAKRLNEKNACLKEHSKFIVWNIINDGNFELKNFANGTRICLLRWMRNRCPSYCSNSSDNRINLLVRRPGVRQIGEYFLIILYDKSEFRGISDFENLRTNRIQTKCESYTPLE